MGFRIINRDGSFNIGHSKRRFAEGAVQDLYHYLLSLTWREFFLLYFLAFVAVNFLFAVAYDLLGDQALSGMEAANVVGRFWDCFFFSVQTLATIGYGKITPNTMAANFLVTLEAALGLIAVAVGTGLVFSRFSRPTARLLFSDKAVINDHDGQRSLLFRIGNRRLNQIAEARVNVFVARTEKTVEGESYRDYYELKLERNYNPMFAMSWTIVHPIDENSPLHGRTKDQMDAEGTELIVTLTGIDETFSQTIHARFSYIPDEIYWDHRFVDILGRDSRGLVTIAFERIHDIVPVR